VQPQLFGATSSPKFALTRDNHRHHDRFVAHRILILIVAAVSPRLSRYSRPTTRHRAVGATHSHQDSPVADVWSPPMGHLHVVNEKHVTRLPGKCCGLALECGPNQLQILDRNCLTIAVASVPREPINSEQVEHYALGLTAHAGHMK